MKNLVWLIHDLVMLLWLIMLLQLILL